MTGKDYLKKYDIKVVILSRGRAESITSNAIFPDYIEIVVPQSQKELYEKNVNNPIIVTPDSIKGLGMLRNWCLDNFKEYTVIMIDDDINHFYNLAHEKSIAIKDKEEAIQILINTAVMSRDLGVSVFGYSQTDIRKYNACDPFTLNSWVGTIIGVNGRKFEFRKDKFKVDIDYFLQALLVDRIVWIDNRYYANNTKDYNVGGNSEFRTQEDYEKSTNSLKEKWGDCIKIKKVKVQQLIKLNIKRRQRIDYE